MLNDTMTERPSIPIAQIDPRFERWRKIRIPIYGGIGLVVIIIAGLLIHSCMVARTIRSELDRAEELASLDTIEAHVEALRIVESLYGDHPSHEAILERYAWQRLLYALRVGPSEPHIQEAQKAVNALGPSVREPLVVSTRAGLLLVAGEALGAETLSREALEAAPTCRECGFVYALTLDALDRSAEAVPILDRARQGIPPFIPALAAETQMLREQGRFDEAQNALVVLSKIGSGHRGAVVEGVLLALDRASAVSATAGGEVVPQLEKHLSAVTVEDTYERRAAFRHYAEGRIALLKGDSARAAQELGAASKVLVKDQRLAMWRARALRMAGRHLEAVKTLEPFPNIPDTDLDVLIVRAELLMDLYRTTDVAPTIAVLASKQVKGASLLEGRRLLWSGAPSKAIKHLNAALREGSEEAALDLIEARLELGQAREIRTLVHKGGLSEPVKSCADGMIHYLRGSYKRVRSKFRESAKAGGRCGTSLEGRLLIGTREGEGLVKRLTNVLAAREDLRDRVALGRAKFRVEGAAAAREELDRVRKLAPQSVSVLGELTEAYEELGLFDEAFEVASEGMKRTNDDPRLLAIAVRLKRRSGQLDEAERLAKEGLKAHSSEKALLVELAAIHLEQRRFVAADKAISEAVEHGPYFSEAVCLRARIQERRGFARDAQIELSKSIVKAISRVGVVETADAKACLAGHYVRRGTPSLAKARANINDLRRRGLIWAEIPYTSGVIAERQRETENAIRSYRDALEIDIAHRKSWYRLARMKRLTDDDRATFERLWPGQDPRKAP